jgi:hypothetical protein
VAGGSRQGTGRSVVVVDWGQVRLDRLSSYVGQGTGPFDRSQDGLSLFPALVSKAERPPSTRDVPRGEQIRDRVPFPTIDLARDGVLVPSGAHSIRSGLTLRLYSGAVAGRANRVRKKDPKNLGNAQRPAVGMKNAMRLWVMHYAI